MRGATDRQLHLVRHAEVENPGRAPWLFFRGRCALASITTFSVQRDRVHRVAYWEI